MLDPIDLLDIEDRDGEESPISEELRFAMLYFSYYPYLVRDN